MRLQFERVFRLEQIVCSEMACVKADQWCPSDDKSMLSAVFQLQPADVCLVTVLLWHHIRNILIGDRALIVPNQRRCPSIGVVIQWAAPIPFELLQFRDQIEGYPNPWNIANAR